jgi:hypothetical protein
MDFGSKFGGISVILYYALLFMGIIYAFQRVKLKSLPGSDFEEIPAYAFEKWKSYEMKSIDFYLSATWGLLIVSKISRYLIIPHLPKGALAINSFIEIAFVVLLVVSAVFGTKAKKLKNNYGISWPKKSAS